MRTVELQGLQWIAVWNHDGSLMTSLQQISMSSEVCLRSEQENHVNFCYYAPAPQLHFSIPQLNKVKNV